MKFDKYCGRNFANGAFPILPVEARWNDHGIDCKRKQFQISLDFAITIHKAQGLTLDKAVIDIGSREYSVWLSYVWFSRVRKLEDLAIPQSFSKERNDKIEDSQLIKDRIP